MFGFSVNILLEHYRMYVCNLFRGPPPQDTLINIVFFFLKKQTKQNYSGSVFFFYLNSLENDLEVCRCLEIPSIKIRGLSDSRGDKMLEDRMWLMLLDTSR